MKVTQQTKQQTTNNKQTMIIVAEQTKQMILANARVVLEKTGNRKADSIDQEDVAYTALRSLKEVGISIPSEKIPLVIEILYRTNQKWLRDTLSAKPKVVVEAKASDLYTQLLED